MIWVYTSGDCFRFDGYQGIIKLTNWEEDWCITWLFSCSNRFSRVSGLTDVSIFETSFSFWFFLGVDDLVPFSVWTEVNLIVRGLWPSEHTKQAELFDLFSIWHGNVLSKVVCVFPMVGVSLLPHPESGPNYHRVDALHFIWPPTLELTRLTYQKKYKAKHQHHK